MTNIRRRHSYIGLFIAPSVLFLALTGAAQIFNLHEAHRSYRPPAILDKLSSVHKDQVFAFGHNHEPTESEADSQKTGRTTASPAAPEVVDDKPGLSTLALKTFLMLVAVCLALRNAWPRGWHSHGYDSNGSAAFLTPAR
jgi:hypothetical protein